jgi:PST family polysaccharide transporter
MIVKLKNKLQSKDNKRLLSNFLSLSVLQGANYVLPLITLPYLARVLGVEYFGLLAFATAMITYFNVIVDYGFNLTATREISIHRNNKMKLIEIFSSVMTIKFILMILSFMLLTVVVFIFEKFSKDWLVYFLTFGTVIGQFLFPVWFFQGIEEMKFITYLNILAKLIFTGAIFIFVQEQNDFYIVPLLTSIGFLVAGSLSLIVIVKKFNIKFELQRIEYLKYYFDESTKVFFGMLSYSMIATTTIFMLGIFTTNVTVGYFSPIEKVIRGIANLVNPISQTLYPYLSNTYNKNRKRAFYLSLKITIFYTFFSFLVLILLFNNAELFISLLFGDKYLNEKTILIFKILSFFPLLYGIVHIFCTQTLLISKEYKIYKSILFIALLINIILGCFLINVYAEVGAAFLIIFIESMIICFSFIYIYKIKKTIGMI